MIGSDFLASAKRVKRKINMKGLILLLLIIYIIVMSLYTLIKMPIKNIYIENTNLISDNEIIEVAGIKNYPAIFKLNTKKIENKIATLELVSEVNVKKKINGSLIIKVVENKPLFYNRNTKKVVLSNAQEVDTNNKYLGIPTLINYVPNDLFKDFIESFKDIDSDIIKMINEIMYDPDINNDVTIDKERFLLRMNDTNLVYVNVINMKRLNNYKEIYNNIPVGTNGTLYLDSYDSSNNVLGLFTPFDSNTGDADGKD